ncbi:hypothetical protein K502DRAFT_346136 [Neoconidiobolus thromboides FSU 785]|nr:hypothetical protein K502DRAFT_346136 [Neoconidiobolus thromboides FSU 785]
MPLKFDLLPDLLLEEIFKLLDPGELFELRFLSKYLFGIASKAIKVNLTYSVYNHHYSFEEYRHIQEVFIKQNGPLMKHIIINQNIVDHITYCPNLISLKFEPDLNDDFDQQGVTVDFKLPKVKLPGLKKLFLSLFEYSPTLGMFADYLNQVEDFEYEGCNLVIKDIISYFNPNNLKSLKLFSLYNLDCDGLDVIKSKFNNLKVLHLRSHCSILTSTKINPNVNFSSNLHLVIKERANCNFNIEYFGILKQLKSIKLINGPGVYFDINNKEKIIESAKDSNIITLGYFDSKHQVNKDFLKLSTLTDVCITRLFEELLSSISLLQHIRVIHIGQIDSYTDIHDKFKLNEDEKFDEKHYSLRCKFVKQAKIGYFVNGYNVITNLLFLFPSLAILKIEYIEDNSVDININLDFNLTTHLLIIIPFLYKNTRFHNQLNENPMIDWVWL